MSTKIASLYAEITVDTSKAAQSGVRKTVMRPEEILVEIAFPGPPASARSAFVKLGLGRAQAISIVNSAVVVDLVGREVRRAAIALGAVAPVDRSCAGGRRLVGWEDARSSEHRPGGAIGDAVGHSDR